VTGRLVAVVLTTTDLDRAVAAGAEVLHGPGPQPWGTSARYLDPDGNTIELTQRP
jgi:predicted enzyme related to lactoylglutathione lyase